MTTQNDIANMTEAELATFANNAPSGFTPVFSADGTFAFVADWVIEKMTPSERLKLTIVGRSQ